jgi:HSP90 family molecular chaperone
MEKITRAQAYANQGKFPSHNQAKKVLEIHPGHPAIRKLLDYVESDPDSN